MGGLFLFTSVNASALPIVKAGAHALAATSWPAWVHQLPDSDLALQAVGIANTREDARQQAQAELMLRISSQSQVQQTSSLRQVQGQAASSFVQQSTASSLPLQLEGLEVTKHAMVNDLHAVLVSVSEAEVVASLHDALTQVSRQLPPEQPVEQLIWALQHYSQTIQGLQIERALQNLNAGASNIRRDLLMQLEQAQAIWSKSSVRVIAQSETRPFGEVLTRQVPAGGQELLWLQLEQQQQTGRKEANFIEKRALQLTLRHSQSPFTIVRQQSLQAAAEARSPQAASNDVQQQLLAQLERPLYDWFFIN